MTPVHPRVPDRIVWGAIALLLAARTALSLHAIELPGLQQDETSFVNAATLRLPGIFMPVTFHGIPLMVFAYTGALKSWLYDPIFAAFGSDATSIRLPVVLIATGGLALVYPAVRDLVNRQVGIVVFLALLLDNNVFWLTRDDVGPSAIEFLLKCAVLRCAAGLHRRLGLRRLLVLLVLLALGVFNKLNFIWIVNAAAVISVLVVFRRRRQLREGSSYVLTWFFGLAVIYGGFGWYYISNHIATAFGSSGSSLTQPWANFQQGMSLVLSGTWFYDYALAPRGPRMVVVWTVIVLFVVGTLAAALVPRTRNLPVVLIAVATLLVAIQTLFTKQATAGWHYIAVYPFVTIVAVYGVYGAATALLRAPRAVTAAMATAAVAAVAYSGVLMTNYFRTLHREPVNAAWSPAIYPLSRDLQKLPGHIYTIDWGLFEPLFALHPGDRYTELAFELASPTPAALAALSASIAATPGPKLFVTHAPADLQFPQVNANLLKATRRHLHLILTVDGANHEPVDEVYAYQ